MPTFQLSDGVEAMKSARSLSNVVIVVLAIAVLATVGWAARAAAEGTPECPTDWPGQGYEGPLREDDRGRIQYEDFHSDAEGRYWYIIRGADSNGYATVRAYPAAVGDGGYITESPDRVCYLIVREPGAPADLAEPRQVLFPRESDEPAGSATVSEPGVTPTPTQPAITPTVPDETEEPVPPVLALLELDGATIDTNEVIREGLEPGQEVQIALRVSDAGGRLAYLALVAEDGAELHRVDCTDGMEQECTLTSTLIAPGTYSTTLRLRLIAVGDAGAETELATISLTTRDRPRPPPTSGSGSGSGSSGSPRVRLEIEPPEQLGPFIADIPAVIYPVVDYTGRYRLYFNLPQGPAGMVIDPDTGVVAWTPPEDDEGRSFDVTIAVTDGSLTDDTTFEITVMDPQRIRSSITSSEMDGNALEITDSDTDLEGLSITSPTDVPITIRSLAELQKIFELADDDHVPEIPDWITPLTDVFVVKGAFATPVELRLPIGELVHDLPEEAQFTDINLYAYTEITEAEGLFWVPVSVGFSYEGTNLDDLTYIVSLEGMQGLAFFGYHVSEPAMPFEATPQNMSHVPGGGAGIFHWPEHRPANVAINYPLLDLYDDIGTGLAGSPSVGDANGDEMCPSWAVAGSPLCPDPVPVEDIECKPPDWKFSETINLLLFRRNDFRCTYSGDRDVEIWIINFGTGCRWGPDPGAPINQLTKCTVGRSVHDLASWLFGAQSAFETLGLGYSKRFEVKLQHIPGRQGRLGFVTPGFPEYGGTLHISNDNAVAYRKIQNVVLHEYFHHAHVHGDTRIPDTARHDIDPARWLYEGMASWFPSEVDVALEDTLVSSSRGARILEVGLDSPADDDPTAQNFDERKLSYERSMFFKFLSSNCNEFYSNVRALLSDRSAVIGVNDPTGIHNLHRVIADSNCDFSDHLNQEGVNRSGNVATGIAYYQYATQLRSDLSLLFETMRSEAFDPQRIRGVLEPDLFVLPGSLPEGERLVYRLSLPPFNDPAQPTPFVVPSTGAYSVQVRASYNDLPDATVIELAVVPVAGNLVVSMVARTNRVNRDDFNAMNTIGPEEDLHAWFSTAETHSYVISRTTVPEFTFTVVNPSPDEAVEANIFVMIRHELDVPHLEDLVSPDLLELSVDREALVDLYNSTDGPNWIDSDFWLAEDDQMNVFRINTWYGVYTDSDRRVTALTLSDNDLRGEIPASLGTLEKLRWLHLAFNDLEGEIPETMGDLETLYALDLRNNQLVGSIPASLGNLSQLNWLDLSENDFTGIIPTEFESLTELNVLALNENELTGPIPAGLGMLEELETLALYSNELSGEIPQELGTLTDLSSLSLRGNQLTGEIPGALGDLDNLENLDLSGNFLSGGIPDALTELRNLDLMDLSGNNLTGGIPENFQNLISVRFLDLGRNDLGGDDSDTLEDLFRGFETRANLRHVDLSHNNFEGDLPTSVYRLTRVTRLDLSNNQFTGEISADIERLDDLYRLDWSDNNLTGELPAELGNLERLERLDLDDNQFTGALPARLGDLANLEDLRLNENMLTGAIPTELGNLKRLEQLYLHENQLDGSIPVTLGDLYNLERLYLYDNALMGSIPAELGNLGDQSVLDELRLENNQLSGSIPDKLGDLVSLTELNLGNNSLDGAIPTALGDLVNLEELLLNNNGLTGAIPAELGDLAALTDLDLSHNQLAQAIPTDLGDLSLLETLHLNNNALADPIPTELGNLANLRSLHLNSNQLTGAIPTELGLLTNLEELVLDTNQLVSTIPTELTNLTNLKVLHLSGNTITGCIPQGLADIADNDLSELNLEDCPP